MKTLADIGWDDSLAQAWTDLDQDTLQPARVIADFGLMLRVALPQDHKAEVSGRLVYLSEPSELPKVGDWVAVRLIDDENAVIESVLPRKSEISRKRAGKRIEKQILATNIDVAFIVQALDNDFSPERLERYLFQLKDSGIQPVIVLNKSDQTDDLKSFTDRIKSIDMPYVICSARTGEGISDMLQYLQPSKTAVLLGSSGVGKSTLTNRLLGTNTQETQEVRSIDGKGRHTTVHREIFTLANGGLLIDTPGIRELQLWGSEEEIEDNFDDIRDIILQCQFNDCRHTSEPGCAINAALNDGSMAESRYKNYLKMKQEIASLQARANIAATRQKQKEMTKLHKQHYKPDRSFPSNKNYQDHE